MNLSCESPRIPCGQVEAFTILVYLRDSELDNQLCLSVGEFFMINLSKICFAHLKTVVCGSICKIGCFQLRFGKD